MDGVLVVVTIVFKGPSRLKDKTLIFWGERKLFLWIEFQCAEGRKYFFEEKESLLVADLIRKENRFGERDVYRAF